MGSSVLKRTSTWDIECYFHPITLVIVITSMCIAFELRMLIWPVFPKLPLLLTVEILFPDILTTRLLIPNHPDSVYLIVLKHRLLPSGSDISIEE